MNPEDTHIIVRAALADFPPAELAAHRQAARERLERAEREMTVACDAWGAFPYGPERLLAVQMYSDKLDSAVAVAGEWGIAAEAVSRRVGQH